MFFIQDSFPLWFRAVHVINHPKVFHAAYQLIKPFLSQRVRESYIFHPDVASLHEHLPQDILPEEFGGKLGPSQNKENVEALHKLTGYFDRLQSYRMN